MCYKSCDISPTWLKAIYFVTCSVLAFVDLPILNNVCCFQGNMDKYQREYVFLRAHYKHVLSICEKFTSAFSGVTAQAVVYYKEDPPKACALLNEWSETRLAKPAFYISSCVTAAYIALVNGRSPDQVGLPSTSFKHGIVTTDILLYVLDWMSRAIERGSFPWKYVVDFVLRVDGGQMYLDNNMVNWKFDICLVVEEECLVFYHGGERCIYMVDDGAVLVTTQ